MNEKSIHKKLKLLLLLLLTSFGISQALAQYSLKKFTINSGGGTITSSRFEIKASIGQVDAGNKASGNNYSLQSGFWHKNTDLIFKNNFE